MPNLSSIEETLRLHDRAMASSSCGITIADATLPELPLIYINEAFTHVTGYAEAETVGRNCRFLQLDDTRQPPLDVLRTALRQGENCTIVIRNYRKNGELFWNELFTSPIFDHTGKLTHFVGVQTDVTTRKRAEDEVLRQKTELELTLAQLRETQAMLVHAEKMSALGQMVAGIAHEINNPVSFVNSNLHSLRGSLGDIANAYARLEAMLLSAGDDAQTRAARQIRAEADLDFLIEDTADLVQSSLDGLGRVKRIIETLRTFSRLDEAALKVTSLKENIASTLLIARAELGTRIEVVLDMDNLPDIRCYPAELNQVFLNVIINAAQAIEGQGRLTIRGRDTGEQVVLQFIDTGHGIPPDVLGKIFNPFFTTKPVGVGTGLGLAIAYKIITDRHHGTIEAASTPGVGTTFTITLPKDIS